MRRTFLATVTTILGLVMLLSFKTHGSHPGNLSALRAVGTSSGTGSTPTPAKPRAAGASPPPHKKVAAAPVVTRTVTGQAVDTNYGPVQIAITLRGTRIVQVQPLQVPTGGQSDQISGYSLPILMQETLRAQSAQIDAVSGATYTSRGYAQSLQSALDKAHA